MTTTLAEERLLEPGNLTGSAGRLGLQREIGAGFVPPGRDDDAAWSWHLAHMQVTPPACAPCLAAGCWMDHGKNAGAALPLGDL